MPCAANVAPAFVLSAPRSKEKPYPEANTNNGNSNTHVTTSVYSGSLVASSSVSVICFITHTPQSSARVQCSKSKRKCGSVYLEELQRFAHRIQNEPSVSKGNNDVTHKQRHRPPGRSACFQEFP